MNVLLSVLDLAPVPSGSTASAAARRTVELAQLADELGYRRHWFAEHHSMPSIASSSPEILIGHAAAATSRIRVGAGGIMLPNHVPLQVAERFHTLEALYPDRIDLGIGRAPGTDPTTSRALRSFDAQQFPNQLDELLALSKGDFPESHPFHSVQVVPDDVTLPPIWILGSSGSSASFAGSMGMGYGFARHFSHKPVVPAVQAYRDNFEPSPQFEQPHVILAVSVVCAETNERAEHLAATLDLVWARLKSGKHGPLPSPEEAKAYDYSPGEMQAVRHYRSLHFVGNPETVRSEIEELVDETEADEVMVSSIIYDQQARLRSYELLADVFETQTAARIGSDTVDGPA